MWWITGGWSFEKRENVWVFTGRVVIVEKSKIV